MGIDKNERREGRRGHQKKPKPPVEDRVLEAVIWKARDAFWHRSIDMGTHTVVIAGQPDDGIELSLFAVDPESGVGKGPAVAKYRVTVTMEKQAKRG